MRPGNLAETIPKGTKADDGKPPNNLWAKIESRRTPRFYIGNNSYFREIPQPVLGFKKNLLNETLE